ncbi:MAG: hypothetical protein M1819_004200 [Sarea resinae]|nr:MAG: hypothetical protein M1819_004200 [Sarea resinae]
MPQTLYRECEGPRPSLYATLMTSLTTIIAFNQSLKYAAYLPDDFPQPPFPQAVWDAQSWSEVAMELLEEKMLWDRVLQDRGPPDFTPRQDQFFHQVHQAVRDLRWQQPPPSYTYSERAAFLSPEMSMKKHITIDHAVYEIWIFSLRNMRTRAREIPELIAGRRWFELAERLLVDLRTSGTIYGPHELACSMIRDCISTLVNTWFEGGLHLDASGRMIEPMLSARADAASDGYVYEDHDALTPVARWARPEFGALL